MQMNGKRNVPLRTWTKLELTVGTLRPESIISFGIRLFNLYVEEIVFSEGVLILS